MTNLQVLQVIEEHEVKLHRIRLGALSFKVLALEVIAKQSMSHSDFVYLLEAARISNDYNDSLTLNKFTCIFSENKLN